MATTDWKYPTAFDASLTGDPPGDVWANPSGVGAVGGSSASVPWTVLDATSLRGRDFGFTSSDIPSGATILGIEVSASIAAGYAGQSNLYYLALHSAGNVSERVGTGKTGPSGSGTPTVGDSTDLWGTSLTAAQICSSAFAVDYRAVSTGTGRGSGNDYFRVRVTYQLTLSGEASITEAGDTAAGTGTILVQGGGSIGEDADTASGTASVIVAGQAGATEDGDSVAATGALPVAGAGSVTEDGDTLAGVIFKDERLLAGDVAEEGDTVAGTGTVQITGTAAIAEDGDTATGTGVLPVAGAGAITDDGDTIAGTAALPISGASTVAEQGDTAQATGKVEVHAAGGIAEEGDEAEGTAYLLALTPASRMIRFPVSGTRRISF